MPSIFLRRWYTIVCSVSAHKLYQSSFADYLLHPLLCNELYGDNFALLAQATRQREDELGLWDPCLICEYVPTLLNHLTLEHLKSLGYYCKIYMVSGSQLQCASARASCG